MEADIRQKKQEKSFNGHAQKGVGTLKPETKYNQMCKN